MKLLLDTHTFLWWSTEPIQLSQTALNLCSNANNMLHLSVASIWEMQIKQDLGKLTLKVPLTTMISEQQQRNDLVIIPVHPHHVFGLKNLPPAHKDPFDRMIISQAKLEDMTLLSIDGVFKHYDVKVIW